MHLQIDRKQPWSTRTKFQRAATGILLAVGGAQLLTHVIAAGSHAGHWFTASDAESKEGLLILAVGIVGSSLILLTIGFLRRQATWFIAGGVGLGAAATAVAVGDGGDRGFWFLYPLFQLESQPIRWLYLSCVALFLIGSAAFGVIRAPEVRVPVFLMVWLGLALFSGTFLLLLYLYWYFPPPGELFLITALHETVLVGPLLAGLLVGLKRTRRRAWALSAGIVWAMVVALSYAMLVDVGGHAGTANLFYGLTVATLATLWIRKTRRQPRPQAGWCQAPSGSRPFRPMPERYTQASCIDTYSSVDSVR